MVRINQKREFGVGFEWVIKCERCGSKFEHTDAYAIHEIQAMYQLGDGTYCPNCVYNAYKRAY